MKMNSTPSNVLLAIASLVMFTSTGCGRDGVKVYKNDAPETPPTLAQNSATMPPAMSPSGISAPDNSGLPPLKYTTPAGWQEKKAADLRVASFSVTDAGKTADVSVIPLSGMAGGDTANVNRWRGQVGLPALSEDEVQKLAEKVTVGGEASDLYDIAGTSPGSGEAQRILATVLHRDGTAWFFKMTGDSDLVKNNKAAFIAFLKSVEFGGLPAPSTMDLSKLPASHPSIPGMAAAANAPESDSPDKPKWNVPSSWTKGTLTQFLVEKFVVTSADNSVAEINVSMLEDNGGGLESNVNRWRGQLAVAPLDKAEIAKLPVIDVAGGKATLVEVTGKNPRNGKDGKLIGLILPLSGRTWFYKLYGDAETVSAEKDHLLEFVRSAKYPVSQ